MPFNDEELLKEFAYGLETGQFPSTLYKYTTVGNLEHILKGQTLKFSRISEFNDVRECYAIIDNDCTRDEWLRYISEIWPNVSIHALARTTGHLVMHPEEGERIVKEQIKETNADLGILCLATRMDNELMWAHYTDSHKGVCLEFDLSKDHDAFCFPKRVSYDDKTRRYNYIRSWLADRGMTALEVIFHKSSIWEYEDEYRIVRINGAGLVKFNIKALRAIYFGTNTSLIDIDAIRNLCHSLHYGHVRFFQMKLDEETGEFKPSALD